MNSCPLPLLAAFFLLATPTLSPAQPPPTGTSFQPQFQKGVCLSHNFGTRGYGSEAARQSLAAIRSLGANYVSISPIGWLLNPNSPTILGWHGEEPSLSTASIRQTIRDAHAVGLKVLLNPHLWIGLQGTPNLWRGQIQMLSDADWQLWLQEYLRFILHWALVAQQENVELFSIGSELETFTRLRPDDWLLILRTTRAIYSGPCTYSANWADELELFPHWNHLEYIGISAYFPIGSGSKSNRLATAHATKNRLLSLSQRYNNKPILFLEAGFRSIPNAGANPANWNDSTLLPPDLDEQRLCYEVLFETYWNEPWFYGIYLWNWFADPSYRPLIENDYLFRNKPAQSLIESYFHQR